MGDATVRPRCRGPETVLEYRSVPFKPQQLPSKLYSDGFHLNPQGAQVFTQALGPELRQLLQNDNFVQSTQSSQTARGSEMSSSGTAVRTNHPSLSVSVWNPQSISSVNLLKIDVEGAEYQGLAAASTEILDRVHRIEMEYHPSGDP